MKENNKINIGDKVNVFFGHSNALFDAEVLYIPITSGDSWHLKTHHNAIGDIGGIGFPEHDQIHYVLVFERIDKIL